MQGGGAERVTDRTSLLQMQTLPSGGGKRPLPQEPGAFGSSGIGSGLARSCESENPAVKRMRPADPPVGGRSGSVGEHASASAAGSRGPVQMGGRVPSLYVERSINCWKCRKETPVYSWQGHIWMQVSRCCFACNMLYGCTPILSPSTQ